MALDCSVLADKSGEAMAARFTETLEEVVRLMELAGAVDSRAAELLRRFMPTCTINDRAANGRVASRRVLGLPDGDDDPTCAEHALVNILEEGRKAMDGMLKEIMQITDEQVSAVHANASVIISQVCVAALRARRPPPTPTRSRRCGRRWAGSPRRHAR